MSIVLDIDLDYFAYGAVHWKSGLDRLSAEDFPPWKEEEIRNFLEINIGLNKGKNLVGYLIDTHDKAFHLWKSLIAKNQLRPPFEVIHIDAHADLGMGDNAIVNITRELLHLDVADRSTSHWVKKSLGEGNYLAFSIACRWIRSLTYVQQGEYSAGNPGDLPDRYFEGGVFGEKNQKPISMPIMKKGGYRFSDFFFPSSDMHFEDHIEGYEPSVDFTVVGKQHVFESPEYDHAIISISPAFTSAETELRALAVLGDYMKIEKPTITPVFENLSTSLKR